MMSKRMVVEIERPDGSRFWSPPLLDEDVDEYIAHFESLGYGVSDIDTSAVNSHL